MSEHPTIGMWGVYPEAMDQNDSPVHSDLNFGEFISSKSPTPSKIGTISKSAKFEYLFFVS